MIETTIAFIAFAIILLIAGAKLWNLVSGLNFYPRQLILIGLIVSILMWGIYFTAGMSSLNQTTTIDVGSGTPIEIVNEDYITIFNFMPILNIILLCIGAMTAIEGLRYILDVVNPSTMRQQYGYKPRIPK